MESEGGRRAAAGAPELRAGRARLRAVLRRFNYNSGEPAPEKITDKIFGFTQTISELKVGREVCGGESSSVQGVGGWGCREGVGGRFAHRGLALRRAAGRPAGGRAVEGLGAVVCRAGQGGQLPPGRMPREDWSFPAGWLSVQIAPPRSFS